MNKANIIEKICEPGDPVSLFHNVLSSGGNQLARSHLIKSVGLLWSVRCCRDLASTTATCRRSTSRKVKNPSVRDCKKRKSLVTRTRVSPLALPTHQIWEYNVQFLQDLQSKLYRRHPSVALVFTLHDSWTAAFGFSCPVRPAHLSPDLSSQNAYYC